MRRRVVSSLVLASSFMLVLPPSWCCLLACQAFSQTTAPCKTKSSCCGHKPCLPSAPREQPPCRFKFCPWSDRQSTPPSFSSIQVEDGSHAIVAILPSVRSSLALERGDGELSSVVHPPGRQIHISNCVWLC